MAQPKFQLDQTVWYWRDGKICSAPIVSIKAVSNLHDDWCHTPDQHTLWAVWGISSTQYRTVHTILNEEDLFASKEDLIFDSLQESNICLT